MVTKKHELNIEKEAMAKLQFESLIGFKKSELLQKTETQQSNELNFYVPEKWNYEYGTGYMKI